MVHNTIHGDEMKISVLYKPRITKDKKFVTTTEISEKD